MLVFLSQPGQNFHFHQQLVHGHDQVFLIHDVPWWYTHLQSACCGWPRKTLAFSFAFHWSRVLPVAVNNNLHMSQAYILIHDLFNSGYWSSYNSSLAERFSDIDNFFWPVLECSNPIRHKLVDLVNVHGQSLQGVHVHTCADSTKQLVWRKSITNLPGGIAVSFGHFALKSWSCFATASFCWSSKSKANFFFPA